jgi:biopolymer transport protein ExbD
MPRGRFEKGKKDPTLTMTSLMDMMTIILLYLLKSFSAEGQILTNADNLVLPNSTSKESPTETHLMIALTNDWIMVDNIPVVRTPSVREKESISIPVVKEKLEVAMLQEENMVKIDALQRVKGEVVIQSDKNIEYDILYKVMSTCGETGYTNIKFAVMGREE